MERMLGELEVILHTAVPSASMRLTADTAISQLGLDSLQLMLFALGIEDNYDIRFIGSDEINTIGDLINYIKEYKEGMVV